MFAGLFIHGDLCGASNLIAMQNSAGESGSQIADQIMK
jgi:hypothetical protein